MRTKHVGLAGMLVLALSSTAYAGSITIPLPPMPPPPPPPVVVAPEPPHVREPEVVFVAPPPPTFIRFELSYPDYYFYDDRRETWFYYEKGHKVHYVRHHEWHDDGRHFYGNNKKWYKVDRDHARRKGWYKHKERRERRDERRDYKKEGRRDRKEERRDHNW